MKTIRNILPLLILLIFSQQLAANPTADEGKDEVLAYKINIKEDIMPTAWRYLQRGFEEAQELNADIILIHLNTYGGLVNIADSMRTKILNSPIPVWVFIDNQAASAGALISIAADSIYMRSGGSIGAAMVVNQTGEAAPDKYQSFMRGIMRATAEAKGKVPVVIQGDTVMQWRRDPQIAEAMVDPSIYIEGVIDTGRILTFTADEAIRWGYSEGKAESVAEIFQMNHIENYRIEEFKPTLMDRLIGFLTSPVVSGILIMVIAGGIYFEMQTPGVGFPLAIALVAAALFFAPLYIEGLAEYYELILFILGIILIAVEIFAIPGFGVVGISGILLVLVGLSAAMIDNDIFRDLRPFSWVEIFRPFMVASLSLFSGLVISIILSKHLIATPAFPALSLNRTLTQEDGFIGVDMRQKNKEGMEGIAHTVLRPGGKVEIEGEIFDAISDEGFIDRGERVKVLRDEAGQIYVQRI